MAPSWLEDDVRAGSVRLHLRWLDSGGAPLLLLHGLGVSGAVWRSFGRRLTPAWAPIAPDLRGHGQSDRPPSGYQPGAYAADLEALLEALRLPPLPVVGHSLGALVALALAARAPGRVAALVLIDPPLDEQIGNEDIEPVYRLRHAAPGELERYLQAQAGYAPPVAQAVARLFRQAADAPFEAHRRAPSGAPWAWQTAPHITCPALLVQADPAHGGVLGDAAARDFAARLPRGALRRINGAAHAIHASQPATLAEAITQFLNRKPRVLGSMQG